MPPALLTATDCRQHIHLIVGGNALAAARCTRSLEVGATPILITPGPGPATGVDALPDRLQSSVEAGHVRWLARPFRDEDVLALGRAEVGQVVDAVFVTTTATAEAAHISSLCRRHRIPINVVDAPDLCSFTLLSTHADGPLQIGVTTSGGGCQLAARIRREVAAGLPPHLGAACDRLGAMRRRIRDEDEAEADEADEANPGERAAAAKSRRMRWLAQMCEYWPLSRLAAITDHDVHQILRRYSGRGRDGGDGDGDGGDGGDGDRLPPELAAPRPAPGTIILAGSGPGHPSLLTLASHRAIQRADVILADKLVPAAILALIPRRTRLHIARKFPGNADAAQAELLDLGLAALQAPPATPTAPPVVVVRLKQGDPYLYGRGAEEVAFFRAHGYAPIVLPGISSALAAPLFAAVPATHRAVADQVLICTATGRAGAPHHPRLPPFHPAQTVVLLMALHRLKAVVAALLTDPTDAAAVWPPATPCAVIERASCPDQRVIRSTLAHVVAAVDEHGSRPPGLLVLGDVCRVLHPALAAHGEAHVEADVAGLPPPPPPKWVVEDGFKGLDGWCDAFYG
ncbi:MAG: hypothetical protein M1826_000513 [Phylliscum demangeonii]|nr:MAG: hypothetical protein M1826_000513 [Phylliscum demangeonii]